MTVFSSGDHESPFYQQFKGFSQEPSVTGAVHSHQTGPCALGPLLKEKSGY